MKHSHRNRKGRYSSIRIKTKRLLFVLLLLSFTLILLKNSAEAQDTKLRDVRHKLVNMQVYAQELEERAAHNSVTVIDPTKYLPSYQAIATAYSCGGLKNNAEISMNCPSLRKYLNGRTASGTVPNSSRTIACSPDMLGKTLLIEGLGKRICEDTGSAITAGRIDIYMDHVDKARAYGVQHINYKIVEK